MPKIFNCNHIGCTSTFRRKADRDRHYLCVHELKKDRKYPCKFKMCDRKGERGFMRKDHLTEHERNYHKSNWAKRRVELELGLESEDEKATNKEEPDTSYSRSVRSWRSNSGWSSTGTTLVSTHSSPTLGSFEDSKDPNFGEDLKRVGEWGQDAVASDHFISTAPTMYEGTRYFSDVDTASQRALFERWQDSLSTISPRELSNAGQVAYDSFCRKVNGTVPPSPNPQPFRPKNVGPSEDSALKSKTATMTASDESFTKACYDLPIRTIESDGHKRQEPKSIPKSKLRLVHSMLVMPESSNDHIVNEDSTSDDRLRKEGNSEAISLFATAESDQLLVSTSVLRTSQSQWQLVPTRAIAEDNSASAGDHDISMRSCKGLRIPEKEDHFDVVNMCTNPPLAEDRADNFVCTQFAPCTLTFGTSQLLAKHVQYLNLFFHNTEIYTNDY